MGRQRSKDAYLEHPHTDELHFQPPESDLASISDVVRLYQQTYTQYLRVMERANEFMQQHAETVGLATTSASN